jgi:fluoride ion exporter CrcB/FEX
VNGFAYSLATFGISYAGVILGAQVSSFLPALPRPRRLHGRKGGLSPTPLVDGVMLLLAAACYGAALAMYFAAPRYWRQRVVFALLLSPPGAMLRYALSKLNTRKRFDGRFPVGTFVANIAATLIIGGAYAAVRRPAGVAACDALHGLQDGFCGCLSTVSTFVVEARTLRRGWAWGYVLGSVVLGHIMILATAGGVRWGAGYTGVCTGSDSV